MSWFSKLVPSQIRTVGGNKRTVPEGLWVKCDSCGAVLYRTELERNFDVCPKCSHHMRIGARLRLQMFLDKDSAEEIDANLAEWRHELQDESEVGGSLDSDHHVQ